MRHAPTPFCSPPTPTRRLSAWTLHRDAFAAHMTQTTTSTAIDCDLLIVGGGINGAGIARDGRPRPRWCCARRTISRSHTSSSSTKLIHGGLRYLEHYEFSLVRKALQEREMLLRSAPHIMRPLRFVMPHDPSGDAAGLDDPHRPVPLRPPGAPRSAARLRRRRPAPACGGPSAQGRFTRGFVYSDGWVDDARLVVLNAVDAREHGATVLTRTRCVDAAARVHRLAGDAASGRRRQTRVQARALVNATGPWAASSCASTPPSRTPGPAAGQGQPHRRAQAVRPPDGLHLPEPGQADRLRDPLRGRLHADRHDRRRAPRRARQRPHRRRRDCLPLRPDQPLLRAADHPGRRGLDLFRRAPADG